MNKTHYIHKHSFRVDADTDQFIKQQCRNLGIKESTYIRKLLEQAKGNPVKLETKESFFAKKELIQEVNYIGNNINQIVKNANSNYYYDYEKKKLFALMGELKNLLEQKL